MKNILTLSILAFQFAIAQPGNVTEKDATLATGTDSTPFLRASSKSMPKVKGTVYINEEWEQASVTTLTENKVVRLLARFNAYSKEIEILKEKDFVALKPVDGISVLLHGKTFVPFKTNTSSKTIFAESMIEGKLSLFRVFDIKIVKAVSDATLLNVENEDRVTMIDKLYIRDTSGKITMLPRKRKEVLSIFDGDTQAFIKKEKLSLKKDVDLIRAINFYNTNNGKSQ